MNARSGAVVTHVSKRLIVVILFILALLSLAGRVLMGQVEYFKSEIEMELAAYGITGVSLESIEGSWQGFHPLLKVHGASLSIPGRSQSLSINHLELSVKLISSLLHGELKLLSLHSKIEKLIVVRDQEGHWWLNDIPLKGQQDVTDKLDVYAFFDTLPDFVSIDIRILQILDRLHDKEYLLQRMGLHSSSNGSELSLTLKGQLPESLGNSLNVELTGDESLQKLYLEVDRLDISSLTELLDFNLPGVEDARVDLTSWIDLQRYQPRQIINDARFTQVITRQISADDSPQPVSTERTEEIRFNLRQKAVYQQGDWQIDSEFSRLFKGINPLPGFNSRFILDQAQAYPQLWVDEIDVKSLQLMLADIIGNEESFKLINKLAIQAKVKNFVAEFDINDINRSALSFDFEHLRSQRSQSIPALNGLQGRIQISNGKGQVQLDSSRLAADFGDFFRLPIKLDELSAGIRFARLGDQLLLESDQFILSNNDIKLEGRGWLQVPTQGAPFMGLRLQYKEGRGSATSRYLPVTVIPEKTLAWLDASIRDARLTHGDLLFHGRLQNLSELTKQQSGEFHALFSAENPQLDIYGGWPSVTDGKGQVSFHNTAMDINFSQVKFAASEVDQVRVQIPDLMHAELLIHAKTDTSADDLLDTLSALPVLNVFDEVKRQKHSVSGLIGSDINILIPLQRNSDKAISVKADADLQNVELSIPEWMVQLDQLNGHLKIDNENLTANNIKGRYLKEPIQLNIASDRENHSIDINMQGKLTSSHLLTSLPDYLHKPVKGKSLWDIRVSIPNDDQFDQKGVLVSARSALKGTELGFAKPLDLTREAQLPLQTDINIKGRELNFKVRAGDQISGRGNLMLDSKNRYQLNALSVLFGDNSTLVVPKQGISLQGEVEHLSIADWSNYFSTYFKESHLNSPAVLKQIENVDLKIGVLRFAGQEARDTLLNLEHGESALKGSIASSLAKGKIDIPYQISAQAPFTAELDYIRWQESQAEQKLDPEIQDMPNLNISSEVFAFKSMEFANFKLKTRNQSGEFVIDQLDISKDNVDLKSSGHWQYNSENKEHVSVFNIDIRGDNFGTTVNNLGLGESIRDGKVKFNGQIGWGGSLFDMNWPTLIGEVQLSLKDGYLLNVDPGAGRFVGLLSLNALPKRLFLDFGDVLNKGMKFDEIKGDFAISGEIMNTKNASMDSDSAKVKIYGSTNLRQKTYDQTMIIIPKIGETLPVIGSLAISNAVGWGLLLLQKIFKKPIEKSVEIEYKVSGTWEDPELTLVPKPLPDSETDSNFNPETNH